jgi:hypothetical protein
MGRADPGADLVVHSEPMPGAKDRGERMNRIFEIRRTHLVHVTQPMVLIAQPNRSGGTLLAQLLDGHPELHSHPPELLIGERWPTLDLSMTPRALFSEIGERHLRRAFEEDYARDKPAQELGRNDQLQRLPMILPRELLIDLFLHVMEDRPCATQRDVLDRYFTSLFNAWLDYQNLYRGPKRWLVAFRGRMRRHLPEFFTDYPDGRHITCVRDLKGNVASQWTRKQGRKDFDRPITNWRAAVTAQLGAVERYGRDKVFILTFRQLLTETESVMHSLANWLGIRFDPILLQPTFNTMPIKANSSFAVADQGVLGAPLENWRQFFTEDEGAELDEATADLVALAEAASSVRPVDPAT